LASLQIYAWLNLRPFAGKVSGLVSSGFQNWLSSLGQRCGWQRFLFVQLGLVSGYPFLFAQVVLVGNVRFLQHLLYQITRFLWFMFWQI